MGTFWKLVLVFGLCVTCMEPTYGQRRGGTGGGRSGGGGEEPAMVDRGDGLEAE